MNPRITVAALACAGSLLVAAPALARGGDGGGGGTTAPAAPVVNTAPCGLLEGPGPIAPESTKANVVFDYKLTNCSAADESYVFSISGIQVGGNVTVLPCPTSTTTLPVMTLRSGDSRGFKVDAPFGQGSTCRIGFGQFEFTATVKDAASGQVVATEKTSIIRMGGA